jgi:hypothetical protein
LLLWEQNGPRSVKNPFNGYDMLISVDHDQRVQAIEFLAMKTLAAYDVESVAYTAHHAPRGRSRFYVTAKFKTPQDLLRWEQDGPKSIKSPISGYDLPIVLGHSAPEPISESIKDPTPVQRPESTGQVDAGVSLPRIMRDFDPFISIRPYDKYNPHDNSATPIDLGNGRFEFRVATDFAWASRDSFKKMMKDYCFEHGIEFTISGKSGMITSTFHVTAAGTPDQLNGLASAVRAKFGRKGR